MLFFKCCICGQKGTHIFDDWKRGIIVKTNPTVCDDCEKINQDEMIKMRKQVNG